MAIVTQLLLNFILIFFQSTPTSRPAPKKYGTDSVANIRHKPGGGNVRIFSEKVVVKNVAPRTDCKPSPRTPQSPRSCEYIILCFVHT